MCNPLAIGIVSAVTSFAGQMQSADQQKDYQNALINQRNQEIKDTYENANSAAITNYTQENRKFQENQAQESQTSQDINVEQRNSQGELLASNLNTGLSLDAVSLDYGRQKDRYMGVQQQSLKNIGLQTIAEKKQTYKNAENQSNSVTGYIASPVNSPSLFSLVSGLGGAYVGSLGSKGSNLTFNNYYGNGQSNLADRDVSDWHS